LQDFALAASEGLREFGEGLRGWRGHGERGLRFRRVENDKSGGCGLQRSD
jgi:hypothetical protein